MADDARVVVAHLFQRSGRAELSESELANAMSLDLGWFPPREAREVVAGLIRAGLMEHTEDGDLRARFPVQDVRVPLGFRAPPGLRRELPPPGTAATEPRAEAFAAAPVERTSAQTVAEGNEAASDERLEQAARDAPGGADLATLLDHIASVSGEGPGTWVARMERVVQSSGDVLMPEVALLVAAAREGIDVTAWVPLFVARLEAEAR